MTMQIIQSDHSSCAVCRWLTFERRNWLALVVASSLLGFGIGNGHTTQGAVQNISSQLRQKDAQVKTLKTQVIPALKSEAGCEHWWADRVTKLALSTDGIDKADLPADCLHPVVK